MKVRAIKKVGVGLGFLMTLLLSQSGVASVDDIKRIQSLEGAAKEVAIKQMREFVNKSLSSTQKSYICMASSMPNYKDYTEIVDLIKREVKKDDFESLTYAEIAYYVECKKKQNPFYKNIDPKEIYYTSEGLSETTLEMIRSMGPLLLEKGPDGKTPLEHVQFLLARAQRYSPLEVQGVYSSIKSIIEIEIIRLENSKEQQVARL